MFYLQAQNTYPERLYKIPDCYSWDKERLKLPRTKTTGDYYYGIHILYIINILYLFRLSLPAIIIGDN